MRTHLEKWGGFDTDLGRELLQTCIHDEDDPITQCYSFYGSAFKVLHVDQCIDLICANNYHALLVSQKEWSIACPDFYPNIARAAFDKGDYENFKLTHDMTVSLFNECNKPKSDTYLQLLDYLFTSALNRRDTKALQYLLDMDLAWLFDLTSYISVYSDNSQNDDLKLSAMRDKIRISDRQHTLAHIKLSEESVDEMYDE